MSGEASDERYSPWSSGEGLSSSGSSTERTGPDASAPPASSGTDFPPGADDWRAAPSADSGASSQPNYRNPSVGSMPSPQPNDSNPSVGSGPSPQPNYSNPVIERGDAWAAAAYPAPMPSPTAEPIGWSEPQVFGADAARAPGSQVAPYNYGYAVPYSAAGPVEHPNATLVLILGVVGFMLNFVAFPFLSPVAWYLGQRARREIRQNPGRYTDSGKVTVGWVFGMIGTLIALAFVVLIVLLILAYTGW